MLTRNYLYFRRFFILSFVLFFIAGCGKFTEEVLGVTLQARFTLRPALLCLIIASIFLAQDNKLATLKVGVKYWLYLFIFYSIFLFIRGVVSNNPYAFIMSDIEPVVFLFTGIIIGSDSRTWGLVNKLFLRGLFIGAWLNLFAILKFISLSRTETYNSLAYEIQYLIWPVLFFLVALPYQKIKTDRYIIVFAFIIYIIEQLAFQKRLPIALGLLSFMLYVYYSGNLKKKKPKVFYFFFIMLLSFFVGALAWQVLKVSGIDLNYSLEAFAERLFSDDEETSTSFENGRYFSAAVIIKSIEGLDILIGQGFGAYNTSFNLWWNLQTDVEITGVSAIEIGQVWPYWKGGVIYWILLNSFTFLPFFKVKANQSEFQGLCKAFIIFLFISFFSQSFVGTQRIFMIIWGIVTGITNSDDKGR